MPLHSKDLQVEFSVYFVDNLLCIGCSHYQDAGGCSWKRCFLSGIATLPSEVQV